jgi:hypothetical protein
MKRELNQNLSGNEIYYTACSLIVTLNNSCSKLHCHETVLQFYPHIRVSAIRGHEFSGVRTQGSGCTVSVFGFRVEGSACMVEG